MAAETKLGRTLKKSLRNKVMITFLFVIMIGGMTGCSFGNQELSVQMIDDNYRTYYEVFLYSFYDSDGDGIGDINGLIDKMDYLNDGDEDTDTDLGINGIWLMPVMPSTTYHKYDVVDYYDIDPEYGTLNDFKNLIQICDERGIKVILDMVINHTSSQNEWFIEACDYLRSIGDADPDPEECPYVEYYNFSREKTSKYTYKVEGTDWYYEAGFWSEMPDLNLENENVRSELEQIARFWMDLGVGGFRLDAAKEYESGNDSENIEILTWYNQMIKGIDEDAYLVAEVWSDFSTYSEYYSSGIDSVFDFEFSGADGIIATTLKKANKEADASIYAKAVTALDENLSQYNENYIDAPFYTNHDLARSAGYYSGEDRVAQTKVAGAMNLFMSGSAFIYYGEELGMKGSGIDENKRAPMQWSLDLETEGMCNGPDGMDEIKMINLSLEEQADDPDSIYQYYKNAIKIRNQNPEIARGVTEYLEEFSNSNVCVLKKTYEEKEILIIMNLSNEATQTDLSYLTLNDKMLNKRGITIKGELETGEETAEFSEGILDLPAFGIVVIW